MPSKSDSETENRSNAREAAGEAQLVGLNSAYELLDFGEGRKLERFAGIVVDRPSPAAKGAKRRHPMAWEKADLIFQEKPQACWSAKKPPDDWLFRWNGVVMELRLSPFGHVGLFPEQVANWRWLESLAAKSDSAYRVKALNLFAYTGGSTIAMAAKGVHVTHVDASKPTLQWAKSNAQRSTIPSSNIRWIVDDVRDFVRRAIKRAEIYDFILMDPPAYGHGADGKNWELRRDLDDLIAECVKLLSPKAAGFLLTGHSPIPSIAQGPMAGKSWNRLRSKFGQLAKHRVTLADAGQRKLDFGYAYRFWNYQGPRTG